jgi:surface polysaccharide O-acyltransferase-like enzyme
MIRFDKKNERENRDLKALDAELLRCLACFFVVLEHCAGLDFTSSILLNSVSRFCVPIFVIISGRFCLTKVQLVPYYLKKCLHLMLIFLFWSSIYILCDIILENKVASFKKIVVSIVEGPTHFWYIYAAIALYLATPILYVFCNHATREQLIYFLILTFFFGSIISFALRTAYFPLLGIIVEKMKIGYTVAFLFLFVFGYYREKFSVEKRRRILLYGAGLLGLFVTFLGTWFLHERGRPSQELLSFFAPNVILYSLAIYVFVTEKKNKLNHSNQKYIKIISKISFCSLGIYLLHPLLLQQVIVKIPGLSLFPNIILISLKAILTFLLSFFFVSILKKGILKKLL